MPSCFLLTADSKFRSLLNAKQVHNSGIGPSIGYFDTYESVEKNPALPHTRSSALATRSVNTVMAQNASAEP